MPNRQGLLIRKKVARVIIAIFALCILIFPYLRAQAQSPVRDSTLICADSIELARPDSLDKQDTTAVRYIMRVDGRDTTLLIPKSMRFRIARDMPHLLTVRSGKIIHFKPHCSQQGLQDSLTGVRSNTERSLSAHLAAVPPDPRLRVHCRDSKRYLPAFPVQDAQTPTLHPSAIDDKQRRFLDEQVIHTSETVHPSARTTSSLKDETCDGSFGRPELPRLGWELSLFVHK